MVKYLILSIDIISEINQSYHDICHIQRPPGIYMSNKMFILFIPSTCRYQYIYILDLYIYYLWIINLIIFGK